LQVGSLLWKRLSAKPLARASSNVQTSSQTEFDDF
jgi:hypothetical protein